MTDDLRRLLGDAFDAEARRHVPDGAVPPPPRFDEPVAAGASRSRARWLAPLAAAAAVVALVVGVVGFAREDGGRPSADRPTAFPPTSVTAPSSSVAGSPAPAGRRADPGAREVGMGLGMTDGATYGVGWPVPLHFVTRFTDARSLQAATRVTVDGRPVTAAWYFTEGSSQPYAVTGHLRPQTYWPAHAVVDVTVAAKGLSAGKGLAFGEDLHVRFRTGAAQVVTVDEAKDRLVLTRDGTPVFTAPVSLGSTSTPTMSGPKVIFDRSTDVSMRGPGFYDPHVKFAQQVSYTGEYLHSAPWNTKNIEAGRDTSNGCTNLLPADAKELWALTRVGDVVDYVGGGRPMQMDEGYADWGVSWEQWLTGGLVPTR